MQVVILVVLSVVVVVGVVLVFSQVVVVLGENPPPQTTLIIIFLFLVYHALVLNHCSIYYGSSYPRYISSFLIKVRLTCADFRNTPPSSPVS